MAFDAGNLSIIVQPISGGGLRFISYRTDDSVSTVTATDYFEDGEMWGLRESDLIFVTPLNGSVDRYVLVVSDIDADGNATATFSEEEMRKSIYDPNNRAADAFNPTNHYFTQGVSGDTTRTVLEFIREGRTNVHDLTVPSDGSDGTAAWERTLERGGSLWVPEGAYLIAGAGADAGGVNAELIRSLDIEFHPNAYFYTDSLDSDFIRLFPPALGAGLTGKVDILWRGGKFDQSNQKVSTSVPQIVAYPPPVGKVGASATCDGLSIRGAYADGGGTLHNAFGRVRIIDLECYAGDHWESAGGDSGVFHDGCDSVEIVRPLMTGLRDSGVYSSRASDGIAGGPVSIRDGRFLSCFYPVTIKRSLSNWRVVDNYFENAVCAWQVAHVVGDGAIGGFAAGNEYKNCRQLFRLEGATGAIVHVGHASEMGGALEDGTTEVVEYATEAIQLFGARYCQIRGGQIDGIASHISSGVYKIFKAEAYDFGAGDVASEYNVFEDITGPSTFLSPGTETAGEAGNNRYYKVVTPGSSGTIDVEPTSKVVTEDSLINMGTNFVRNASFDHWQAGTSFSAVTYGPDLYKISTTAARTFSRQTGYSGARYCLRVQRDAANAVTTGIAIAHVFSTEAAMQLAGKSVWLSADIRAGADFGGTGVLAHLVTGTGTDEAFNLAGNSFTTGTVAASGGELAITTTAARIVWGPFTVASDATEMAFRIITAGLAGTAGAADYFEITNIKLEEGDSATAFEAEPIQVGLEAAQRRYQSSFAPGTTPAQNIGTDTGEEQFPAPLAGAVAMPLGRVTFPVQMKAAPTVSTYNPSAANSQARDETAAASCSSTSTGNITAKGFNITTTGNAATAAGNIIGVHWTADARTF